MILSSAYFVLSFSTVSPLFLVWILPHMQVPLGESSCQMNKQILEGVIALGPLNQSWLARLLKKGCKIIAPSNEHSAPTFVATQTTNSLKLVLMMN